MTESTKSAMAPQSAAAASSWALIGAVITTVSNFVMAYLISTGGLSLAGVFWSATATATILGNSASLGTMTGLVYFLPQELRAERPNPRRLLSYALMPVTVLSVLLMIGVAVGAGAIADQIASDASAQLRTMLVIVAPAIVSWAISQTLLGASRGLGTMTPTVVVSQIMRPGLQILAIGGLYLATSDPSPAAIAWAWSLPVHICLIAAVFSVGRLGGYRRGAAATVSAGAFWSYTRFRALSAALQIALERVDVILVSAILGTGPAGIYGSLTRYVSAGNFLIFSVSQAMSAHLRYAITASKLDRAQQLLQRTAGWMVLISWPYFLLLATKAEPLAMLINSAYRVDAGIMIPLALGMLINAYAGPIDIMLLMLGKSQASLAGVALAMVIDVVVLIVLAPRIGLVGAAIAWSCSVVAQNALASWLVYRETGITQFAPPAAITAAIAVIAVVPVGVLTPNTMGGTVVTTAVAGIITISGALMLRDRIGLEELIPARFLSRLPEPRRIR